MSFLGMFLRFVLAFIISVLIFYQLPELPPLWLGTASVCLAIILAVILRFSPVMGLIALQAKPLQHTFLSAVNILFGLIIGLSWAFWQSFFMPTVPEAILNQPVWIEGEIIDLPNQTLSENRVRLKYLLKINSISTDALGEENKTTYAANFDQDSTEIQVISYADNFLAVRPKVTINWYLAQYQFSQLEAQPIKLPKLGETWRMRVKLKSNHASMNPGAFDYEAWLFQKGIRAKGYVKNYSKTEVANQLPKVLERIEQAPLLGVGRWRDWLANRLGSVFANSDFSHFYKALTYGDKSDISADHWALLQSTGTIHLMAISGLHMGIVAMLGFWCFKGLWWLGIYRIESINLPSFAAVGALLFATLYLMLSGFSIPTQRAWLMVVAVLLFVLIRRQFQPWSALALAALLIVLWDSSALLSFGFWLSFMAVALIFAGLIQDQALESKLEKSRLYRWKENLKRLLWIQLLLTIGLAPLLVGLFNSLPLYSFVANLIAVPFVSLLGLPVLFISSVLGLFSVEAAQWMIAGLDWFWGLLWNYLSWLSQLPYHSLSLGGLSFDGLNLVWILLLHGLLFCGLNLRAQAKTYLFNSNSGLNQQQDEIESRVGKDHLVGKGNRLIALMLLLMTVILAWNHLLPERPEFGQAKLTVLDVGQGQAIVVETQSQVLVYDTGAKWGDSMDGAKLAVFPYLKSQSWQKIDRLIVSHSDIDHAGGMLTLLQNIPVDQVSSGQPAELNQTIAAANAKAKSIAQINNPFTLCHNPQQWTADGVQFEILSPNRDWVGKQLKSDNDLSCVLKITSGNQAVLIMGDLTKRGEALLIKHHHHFLTTLKADLLIAGHHGSKHSTTAEWLKAVSPSKVVFSAGYLNRFNFPSQAVLDRLQNYREPNPSNEKIRWWNTACSGAVSFELNNLSIKLTEEHRKSQRKWYHHACLEQQRGHLFQ